MKGRTARRGRGGEGVPLRELRISPIERAETIPSRWYTDPRFHDLDRRAVFSETWQHIGRASQIARPGDYAAGAAAGNPVLAVRGKDSILRAFFNVCRHRGGPLVTDEAGSCQALQCKYHGWTYTLDGMLRGVPKFDRVELFDRKDFGLRPVPVEVWEGLLFVNLSASPAPLASVMQGIAARMAPASVASMTFTRRVEYTVRCNWKVYVDNYLEGYHLAMVHPGLASILDVRNYTTETSVYHSLQRSPLGGTTAGGEALYYFVFPNFMLNILPGRVQTNLVVPRSTGECTVVFDYYYDDVASPGASARIEEDIRTSDSVQLEDIAICEHVQRGLESVAYERGRFSVDMEQGVYHFQTLLKQAYRGARLR